MGLLEIVLHSRVMHAPTSLSRSGGVTGSRHGVWLERGTGVTSRANRTTGGTAGLQALQMAQRDVFLVNLLQDVFPVQIHVV